MNWISVKERLPEQNIGVLISDGKKVTTGSYAGKQPRFKIDYSTMKSSDELSDVDVWDSYGYGGWECECWIVEPTHWMPLPEPPEREICDERFFVAVNGHSWHHCYQTKGHSGPHSDREPDNH